MFSKLNNRIARTLIAVALPAATLGLAGNTFGAVDRSAHVMQVGCQTSLTFYGNSNGNRVTFQMWYVSPRAIRGTITINNDQYEFYAYVTGDNIRGVLMNDGQEVVFDAVGQADLLYLRIQGKTVTLQLAQ